MCAANSILHLAGARALARARVVTFPRRRRVDMIYTRAPPRLILLKLASRGNRQEGYIIWLLVKEMGRMRDRYY